jgi:hypothetical protein
MAGLDASAPDTVTTSATVDVSTASEKQLAV